MKYTISALIVVLFIYAGAVLGIRLALEAAPKFIPAADPVANIEQFDIGYGGGQAILPSYQLQPAVDVRGLK